MAHLHDRMGVGNSRNSSRLLTVTPQGHHGHHGMHGGMGIVGVDDAIIAAGVGEAMENDAVKKFMQDAMSTLTGGIYNDISSSMKAETLFPKVAAAYVSYAHDIENLLGTTPGSKEAYRVYFRLGELAAKINPKVKTYKYGYAGPKNNNPDNANQEGSDFRTSTGSAKTATGIENRWAASGAEEFFTAGAATGRAGRRLEVQWSVCETMYRIRECLKAIPNVAARKGVFAGMLVKYVGNGGEKTLAGMSFLGAPLEVPPTIVAVLADRYTAASRAASVGAKPGSKGYTGGNKGSDKKDDLPVDSGGSGLILGIAALAGAYLLTKG
jgi:hypothetical protein